jgi:hypothetical protein
MADDWIKMRTDLYRDPKVCVIADMLMDSDSDLSRHISQITQRNMTITRNVMRNVTVGALVSVWGVLRHRGKRIGDDLVVKGCNCLVIDDVSDVPGFGLAMFSVKWVEEVGDDLVFPRFFEEFNVDPTHDSKAKNAERQRRYRENKSNATRNVTVTSQSNAREEKRREENITNIAQAFDDKFNKFWKLYPKKKSKGDAEKAFKQLRIDDPLLTEILLSLELACKSEDWMKDGGKYIPYPASWLRAKGWLDVIDGSSVEVPEWQRGLI